MNEIRVFVADDHAVLRAGLKLLINTQADMKVIGEAGDFPTTREKVRELSPDVITLDLSMPGADALRTIEELSAEMPSSKVLVLTMHDDASMLRTAIAAGAAGYIVKSSADTELLTAIRTVADGRTFINLPGNVSPSVPETHAPLDAECRKTIESLSVREREVLRYVALGHTNQAIADRLLLSVKTVESYRARLMAKLKVATRAELTQFAMKSGVMQSE